MEILRLYKVLAKGVAISYCYSLSVSKWEMGHLPRVGRTGYIHFSKFIFHQTYITVERRTLNEVCLKARVT